MRKALALLSGGLDSFLAAKMVLQQGIHVEGINFFTGFTGVGTNFIPVKNKPSSSTEQVAQQLKIKLHVVDVVDLFKDVLLHPKYGYGANINPCLDCKIFMVMQAYQWMREHEFDFLITGEVIGQRPMSQRRDTMPIVAKNTDDLLLRPLCAKLLSPTLPEREGWVQRELLGAISGRNRKPQIAMAEQFGFTNYPQPGGGCVLTDLGFAKRWRDFLGHQRTQDYTLDDIKLLRVGRHLRFIPKFKLIVGRDQYENGFLEQFTSDHPFMLSTTHIGPLVLLVATDPKNFLTTVELELAAQITAYFGKGRAVAENVIQYKNCNAEMTEFVVKPLKEINSAWYI